MSDATNPIYSQPENAEGSATESQDSLTPPDTVIQRIVDHHRDYPDHGTNCSCMDELIHVVRRATTVEDLGAQQRVDYVFRAAIEGR